MAEAGTGKRIDRWLYSCRLEAHDANDSALDDDLITKAQAYTGVIEKSSLVREALIERESARRLALLGGSDPDAVAAPRRREA